MTYKKRTNESGRIREVSTKTETIYSYTGMVNGWDEKKKTKSRLVTGYTAARDKILPRGVEDVISA